MKTVYELIDIDEDIITKAIDKSIELHGEEINGYVEYDSLFLDDKTAGKIVEKGREYFYDVTNDYNEGNKSDFQYHIDTILSELTNSGIDLDEFDSSDIEQEIYEKIRDNIPVLFDYEKALNLTKVNLNISLKFENEYVEGYKSLKQNADGTLKSLPEGFDKVFSTLHTSFNEFKFWYDNAIKNGGLHTDDSKKNKFMYSIFQEIENCYDGFTHLVFCIKTSLGEALSLKENTPCIKIDRNTPIGLYDSWNGGGGVLEISPNISIVINLADDNIEVIADESNSYPIKEVFGLDNSFWEDFKLNPSEDKKNIKPKNKNIVK